MEQTQQAKRPVHKRWWFWVAIPIALLILIGIVGGNSDTPSSQQNDSGTEQATQTDSGAKEYREIFTFSGNGQKKSEPFSIQGDRFKIAYDCTGDPAVTYCGAFVYKVGSQLPQGVMNSSQPVKDETVIYTSMAGKGEYYIDANVLGNFTMTVYDYR